MTGVTCPLCGGDIEEISEIDGAQCETCGFRIRSDGTYDYSDVEEYMDVSYVQTRKV